MTPIPPQNRNPDLLHPDARMAWLRLAEAKEGGSGMSPLPACPTNTLTVCPGDPGVFCGELMAADALRLRSVASSRRESTKDVLSVWHRLEVAWIHASAIPAQVIDFASCGNCSAKEFKGEAVSWDHLPGSVVKSSPTPSVIRSEPFPTLLLASAVHLRPEPIDDRNRYANKWTKRASTAFLSAMSRAQSDGFDGFHASIEATNPGSLDRAAHGAYSSWSAGRGDLAGGRCVRAQRPLLLEAS